MSQPDFNPPTTHPDLTVIEGTRVCRACGREQPLSRFIPRKDREYVYPNCRDCTNAKRQQVNRERAKPPELKNLRVLPPYSELKEMYLSGMTVTEIAMKFDVSRTSVWYTMRARARRFGDPWPLPLSEEARRSRMSRALEKRSVNPSLIIALVYEYIADNEMTLRAFAEREGFNATTLTKIHSQKMRISKALATRLLLAIGEQPGPVLAKSTYEFDRKYTGAYGCRDKRRGT